MPDYNSIDAGETIRSFSVVAKATASAIVSGTVNYFLKAKSGVNIGKWYRNSDSSWQVLETANAMTYEDGDADWSITLTDSPFVSGLKFLEYIEESNNLHIPNSRQLQVDDTSGTGDLSIDLTVDDGTDPIEGARITFRQGATILATALTDEDGQAEVALEAGTYTRIVTATGYNGSTVEVTIDEADDQTISLDAIYIEPSASPNTLTLYAVLRRNGLPVEGEALQFRMTEAPVDE